MKIKVSVQHATLVNGIMVDVPYFYSLKPHHKFPDKLVPIFLNVEEEVYHVDFETIEEAKEYAKVYNGTIVYDNADFDVIQ